VPEKLPVACPNRSGATRQNNVPAHTAKSLCVLDIVFTIPFDSLRWTVYVCGELVFSLIFGFSPILGELPYKKEKPPLPVKAGGLPSGLL
jgi:hypothetical protein